MEKVQKAGRFYTGIIMRNIGIFIFIGMMSVMFQTDGWFPNENMYAISQFTYWYILPGMIAYAGGNAVSGMNGGIIAIMGICGILTVNPQVGIFSAMVTGPLCGVIWRWEEKLLREHGRAGLQMLLKNLLIGISGCICAAVEYYFLAAVVNAAADVLSRGVDALVTWGFIPLLSILIEPAKIFFMNNLVNHGVLIPLGMAQAEKMGYSALFLLEANPGPGLGMLLALWKYGKGRRGEYVTAAFTEAVGGVHEVYFPYVLEDLRMLVPLILGGMTGGACFTFLKCGVKSAVSPGSIITILLMAGKENLVPVALGILASAFVTFVTAACLIYAKEKKKAVKDLETTESEKPKEQMKEKEAGKQNMYQNIRKIAFVCSGGMGSSAMGAALCRRTFEERKISGIKISACAADMIAGDVDLIVCQEDFFALTPELKDRNCHLITNFVLKEEYIKLAEAIKK